MPTAPPSLAIPRWSRRRSPRLISKAYAAELRARIDPARARPAAEIRPALPPPREGGNTTHFSVVDRFGNAVANTYTLNFSYGVGLVAEGTGILLNNELDDFAAKPGAPNAFGLLGGDANAPGPGKRPLSSMTPTIVLKDGKPFLVTGSPGGSRIITAVLQVIIERDRPQACRSPRRSRRRACITNGCPTRSWSSAAFRPISIRALEARGHTVVAGTAADLGELDPGDAGRPRRRRRQPHAGGTRRGVLRARACALILRSAHDVPAQQEDARVRGSRRMGAASCFETHRSVTGVRGLLDPLTLQCSSA